MTALANASRFLIRPGALPLVLLLGALSSVFLFGHPDRGHFYRDGHHDWLSSQGLAQAVNFSFADGLLLFVDRTHDADGDLTYSTYARWPIGSYALIKLTILPFEGDLSATIQASRVANLMLFTAAAVVAYLAFARLVGRWVALTATLIHSPRSSLSTTTTPLSRTESQRCWVCCFYLRVVARDARVPAERSRRRFDESFYFKFKNWGIRADGDCVAQVKLPSYAIHHISTGRVVPGAVRAKAISFNELRRSDAADKRE